MYILEKELFLWQHGSLNERTLRNENESLGLDDQLKKRVRKRKKSRIPAF